MQLPVTAGGVSLPADPVQAMKLFSQLGLRSFPATYGDKTPHPRVGAWGVLATSPPLPEAVIDQIATWGRVNVALICDEHLVVFDIDNLDFAQWFDASGPERLGTWVVRSPSGGLHVYVRSSDAQRTTVVKAANGVKIGDVKARGGYVIAPPSVGSNGDYQTEYGSPDAIALQANALTWFQQFVDQWERTQPVRLQPAMTEMPEYANTRVHGAPPPSRQEEILNELRTAWLSGALNRKVYDTLADGVDAADGYWKNPNDRSDVDYGCIKEAINLGWTFPQIEEAWSFLPVGERYREGKHGGHGYLLRTYDAAKKKWDADNILKMTAVGPNFSVQQPVERFAEHGETHYSFGLMHLTRDEHPTFRVTCPATAFLTPMAFRKVCYQQSHFIDLGNNFDTADKLRTLAEVVNSLAVERDLPEAATYEGGLRIRLVGFVTSRAIRVLEAGEQPEPFLNAWRSGEHAYVNANGLMRYFESLREVPKRRDVWQEWQRLGGDQAHGFGPNVWRLPASQLDERALPPS